MGKFYRHLYPQIYDCDNLWLAWRKTLRGKRGQPPAATLEMNVDLNLLELQVKLEGKAKHKEASHFSSPLMIPGRAPLVELRSPACGTK